jgi:hypothetical protein
MHWRETTTGPLIAVGLMVARDRLARRREVQDNFGERSAAGAQQVTSLPSSAGLGTPPDDISAVAALCVNDLGSAIPCGQARGRGSRGRSLGRMAQRPPPTVSSAGIFTCRTMPSRSAPRSPMGSTSRSPPATSTTWNPLPGDHGIRWEPAEWIIGRAAPLRLIQGSG